VPAARSSQRPSRARPLAGYHLAAPPQATTPLSRSGLPTIAGSVESEEVGLKGPASVRSLKRLVQFSRQPLSAAAPPWSHRGTRPGMSWVSRTRPNSPISRRVGSRRHLPWRQRFARHAWRRCSIQPSSRWKSRLTFAWREKVPHPRMTGLIRSITSRNVRGAVRRVSARLWSLNRCTDFSRGMAYRF